MCVSGAQEKYLDGGKALVFISTYLPGGRVWNEKKKETILWFTTTGICKEKEPVNDTEMSSID